MFATNLPFASTLFSQQQHDCVILFVCFSQQLPNLDDLFNRLRNEISFNPDQILTEETRDSLTQYSDAGLQSIDYVGYIEQINTAISNLDVDGLITTMQTVRAAFALAGQVSTTLTMSPLS